LWIRAGFAEEKRGKERKREEIPGG